MTVYVDDMFNTGLGRYRRMKMSHLYADGGQEELLPFARRIGVNLWWLQNPGMGRGYEHFDLSMSKREAAIAAGAVPITLREMSKMVHGWRREAAVAREAQGREGP